MAPTLPIHHREKDEHWDGLRASGWSHVKHKQDVLSTDASIVSKPCSDSPHKTNGRAVESIGSVVLAKGTTRSVVHDVVWKLCDMVSQSNQGSEVPELGSDCPASFPALESDDGVSCESVLGWRRSVAWSQGPICSRPIGNERDK